MAAWYDLTGKKALVIGGDGFIGRHVCTQLRNDGAAVRVYDRNTPPLVQSGYDWIVGSVDDRQRLAQAAKGCDVAIYLAAAGLPSMPMQQIEAEIASHVATPLAAAELCAQEGVERYIFASSGGTVYGRNGQPINSERDCCRPVNVYGASKLSCEYYLDILGANRGMKILSLRVSNPFGEGQVARGQGFIAAALQCAMNGEPLSIWGDGSAVRDYVYIDDVARAFSAACSYTGAEPVINIGSGHGVSLLDVIEKINIITGIALKVEYEPGRASDIKANVLDVSLAAREFGWVPQVTFDDGLERAAHWWMENHISAKEA